MALLIQFEDKFGRMGYQNEETQEIVIPSQYDEGTSCFGSSDSYNRSPYASVLSNSKCGIIDEKGDVVIPIEYEEAYYLFDDLFAVRKSAENGEWILGVINSFGEVIVPFKYKSIQRSNAFIKCSLNASSVRIFNGYGWGSRQMDMDGRIYRYDNEEDVCWINKKGDIIYNGDVVESAYNVLIIEKQGKLGAIDTEGQMVVDFAYDEMHCPCINRFIVRMNSSEDDWRFGVLDEQQKCIVDFNYKYIKSKDGSFYQCYARSLSTPLAYKPINKNYEYSETEDEVWLNSKGEKIVFGGAEVLSDKFLLVERNDKYGVYNQNGKRIVNFLYDEISERNGKLAVSKGGKVGILGENGEVIIDASYEQIECVHITNERYGGYSEPLTFGKYSPENPFDTSSKNKSFFRRLVRCNRILRVEGEFFFSLSNVFILHNNESSELFTIEDGILPDSRFKTILALTDTHFAVKDEEKWGVYSAEKKRMVIPCEYDRIKFEGGHTVLLCKDDKWGAKDLSLPYKYIFTEFLLTKVDIPIAYEDLKILNETQTLFGAKKHYQTYFEKEDRYNYVILTKHGTEFEKFDELKLEEQFTIFDNRHILSKKQNRFGFVSLDGFITIPFIFDEIKKRSDNFFDVRIGNCWGVIDINGRELVSIKYKRAIGFSIKEGNASPADIVTSSISNRQGIIDYSGREIVPTVFEYLMICEEGGFFFCYDGFVDESYSNFFTDIRCATWGYMNSNGDIVIDAKYDCFKINNGFILAGRDGCFVGEEANNDFTLKHSYTGVYDLYTMEGELIIGGFREFIYDKQQGAFAFFFGGEWGKYCSYSDGWNNLYFYDWKFNYKNDLWLILDKDLNSIIRNDDGTQYHFNKGFIGKIDIQKEDKKVTHVYNMPINLMAKGFVCFGDNCAIIKNSNEEDYCRKAILDIKTGIQSDFFDNIKQVSDSLFFLAEEGGCGMTTIRSKILPAEYLMFTFPIEGYFFAAKNMDDSNSQVSLRHTSDPTKVIAIAINSIKTDDLIDDIGFGRLKMDVGSSKELHDIKVPLLKMFDKSFQSIINQEETLYSCKKWDDYYYFANDWRFGPYDDYADSPCDDRDYMRDTWDAMTDGMYGDMPDGWDGDYEFLGY